MAAINPRPGKDGKFTFQITVTVGRDSSGKKINKTTTFTAKATTPGKARKEAEAFANKFEETVKNGDLIVDEKLTYSDLVDIWEKNWLPAKSPTVKDNYMDVQRIRILPFIGHMKINKIKAPHIDAIIAQEKEEEMATKTIRMTFTVINSVMKYAYKKRYIKENPCLRCDDLPPIKLKKIDELQYFTLEQAKRFLNDALTKIYYTEYKGHTRKLKSTGAEYKVDPYMEGHKIPLQWRAYFTIALLGGFRRGEMCALTWKDINPEKKTITINKALAATKEGQIVKDPKTDAGKREIKLPDICFYLLDLVKKEQIQMMLKMGDAWEGHRNETDANGKQVDSLEDNTVFTQLNGKPVHLSTPSHKFGEIIELYNSTCEKDEEKLPKIRLHDLRHTSISLLLAQNTDIETVSRRAGHSKASVTLDIYGHFMPEKDQQASDTLGDLFGS